MSKQQKCKPYPWKCPECKQKEIHPVTEPYETVYWHYGIEYPIYVKSLEFAKCKNCGIEVLENEAWETITTEFRKVAGLLSPEEIRKGRELLKLTQYEMGSLLGVTEIVVSRWEAGIYIHNLAMDILLRQIFSK